MTSTWLVQWSHHCSCMRIPVHSPGLPDYIDVVQTVLVILTMAGLLPDRPHISTFTYKNTKCGLDMKRDLERGGIILVWVFHNPLEIALVYEKIKCSSLNIQYLKLGWTVHSKLQVISKSSSNFGKTTVFVMGGSIGYGTIQRQNASPFLLFAHFPFISYIWWCSPAKMSWRSLWVLLECQVVCTACFTAFLWYIQKWFMDLKF